MTHSNYNVANRFQQPYNRGTRNRTYNFCQRRNDLAQRGETLVNVGAFLQSGALSAGRVRPLGAGQIDQTNLRNLLGLEAGHAILALLGEENRKHSMGSRARLVHVGRRDSTIHDTRWAKSKRQKRKRGENHNDTNNGEISAPELRNQKTPFPSISQSSNYRALLPSSIRS